MTVAPNATDAFNISSGSATKATSATGTIPAGATVGDTLFMVFDASNTGTNAGTVPTLSVTSTGSAWTQVGTTQTMSIASFAHCWSSLWMVTLAAGDLGATVTVHSTTTYYLAAAAAGYGGVAATAIDAFATDISTAGVETIPSSTVTSSLATDWLIYFCSGTSDVSMVSVTKPATCTLRSSNFTYNEHYVGIADLNAACGSGTVGGASWTCGAFSGFVMWTVVITAAVAPTMPAGNMMMGLAA